MIYPDQICPTAISNSDIHRWMNGRTGCGLCITQWDINQPLKRRKFWASLVVQWLRLLASNAGGMGSIPGQGSKDPTYCMVGPKSFKKRIRNSNMSLEDIMYFEDTMLSGTSSKKIKTVSFYSYEVSRVVKSRKQNESCQGLHAWEMGS